jgi:hypothetical protein
LSARDAAPRAVAAPGGGLTSKGNPRSVSRPRRAKKAPIPTTPLPLKLLEPRIAERLRGAGIKSCEQWQALTPIARSSIWGITKAARIEVDACVTAALERGQGRA